MRIRDCSSDVCSSDLIKRIEGERRVLHQRIARLNGAATRSTQLGERLLAHVQRTAQAVGFPTQYARYTLAHADMSPEEDRKSVVEGKGVPVRVDIGGSQIIKKKK